MKKFIMILIVKNTFITIKIYLFKMQSITVVLSTVNKFYLIQIVLSVYLEMDIYGFFSY